MAEPPKSVWFLEFNPQKSVGLASHDQTRVRQLQQNILNAYRSDISKHTTPTESMRIRQVLDSLLSQLAKENKKFIYGAIKKGARAKEFELAIQWLVDAGIVCRVYRVKEIRMPVKFYEDLSAFKLFLADVSPSARLA